MGVLGAGVELGTSTGVSGLELGTSTGVEGMVAVSAVDCIILFLRRFIRPNTPGDGDRLTWEEEPSTDAGTSAAEATKPEATTGGGNCVAAVVSA